MSKKTRKALGGRTWREQLEHVKKVMSKIEDEDLFDIIEWIVLNFINGVDDAVRYSQDGKGNSVDFWDKDQKLNVLSRIWGVNNKAIQPLFKGRSASFNLGTDAIAKNWGIIEEGECLEFESIKYPNGKTGIGIKKGIGITQGELDGLTDTEQEIIKNLALNNQSGEA
mgnify:FL=1